MNKTFPQGAITIDAANRMECLRLIQTHEEQGYDFMVLNDARKLRYRMLGLAGAGEPLVWLTLAMAVHHSDDLEPAAGGLGKADRGCAIGNGDPGSVPAPRGVDHDHRQELPAAEQVRTSRPHAETRRHQKT